MKRIIAFLSISMVVLSLFIGQAGALAAGDAPDAPEHGFSLHLPMLIYTGSNYTISGAMLAAQSPHLSGAIFTTTPDGSIVNENVRYESKLEVYLDGGPPPQAPQTAAGLPDDYYVFQVTDPSGKFLLSEDPAKCRIVRVEEGIIVELVDPSFFGLENFYTVGNGSKAQTFPCHVQDEPDGVAGPSGRHDTNTDVDHGEDGAIVVQLMPFGTTPNPGGVYKAWITPVEAYENLGGDLDEVPSLLPPGKQKPHSCPDFCAERDAGFGPPLSMVKTDNFKAIEVIIPPEITVRKFHDLDGDGVWDAGEPEIGVDQLVLPDGSIDGPLGGGWPYNFTYPLDGGTNSELFYTPKTHIAAIPGKYIACEEYLTGWGQSAAYLDGGANLNTQCVEVDVAGTSGETHEIVFGNFRYATKFGYKYHDLNANGAKDTGEPGLDGWTIKLDGADGKGNPVHSEDTTSGGGYYEFSVPPGAYTVSEVCTGDWRQSEPAPTDGCGSGKYEDLTFISGDVDGPNNFGNYLFAKKFGYKYHDLNGNGTWDSGEPGLDGWTIKLDGTNGLGGEVHLQATTSGAGRYEFNVPPGAYDISEVCLTGDWYQSEPLPTDGCGSGVYEDEVFESGVTYGPNNFGNYRYATKSGYKYHDLNANGVWDGDEPGLGDWTIKLDGANGMGGEVHLQVTTAGDGFYQFSVPPGTYDISEVCPEGWFQSEPAPTDGCGSGIYEDEIFASGVTYGPNNFGNFQPVLVMAHKFYDLNENGIRDPDEDWLDGFEFCLKDGGGNLVSNDDFVSGVAQAACQETNANGVVLWTDLYPGTYTVEETLPEGWFPTKTRVFIPDLTTFAFEEVGEDATVITFSLLSGEEAHLFFGDVGNCAGLTPGYWKNWRNHYTSQQFLLLLEGTIAEGDSAYADAIFADYDASPDDEITILRAMLLANQLTLNLTQHPELPNPSGGSLFNACRVPGYSGNLGYWIAQALEIHANPEAFTREYILEVKTMLDKFANLMPFYS